jgi:hypothetical protein
MEEKLKKMNFMEGYLLAFNPNVHEYKNEEGAINKFLINPLLNKEDIEELLQEGQEVLAMDPFPWEWIEKVTNRLVFDKEKNDWVDDPKIYKLWLEEILSKLAIEAKILGKL